MDTNKCAIVVMNAFRGKIVLNAWLNVTPKPKDKRSKKKNTNKKAQEFIILIELESE